MCTQFGRALQHHRSLGMLFLPERRVRGALGKRSKLLVRRPRAVALTPAFDGVAHDLAPAILERAELGHVLAQRLARAGLTRRLRDRACGFAVSRFARAGILVRGAAGTAGRAW